jgi:hypothetical protein
MMVSDSLKAIGYRATPAHVDSQRLATLGLSMGSRIAWWPEALDERVKVRFDLCCLTEIQALLDARRADGLVVTRDWCELGPRDAGQTIVEKSDGP